jgi:beta-galactosidase
MAIYYGGDYNPEQWPEQVWDDDIRLMRRAGVNLATVGVFSWARIQPDEGVHDYGWLDRVLDKLHAGGVAVDLATGTASTPPWATARYPGIHARNAEGATLWPGSRQHYAPTSLDYRRLAAELVHTTVERYKDHPAVVLWHINNEYGCHTPYDYSENAAVAFRAWLRARYGDIGALNDAWGTNFWSQRYTDFAQIVPPRLTPTFVNPGELLDFRRFSSDAMLDLLLMEKQIILQSGASQPITTNFMGAFPPVDYWRWAEELDVISDDNYVDPRDPDAFRTAAFSRDLMRSLKPGTPWLLMEQAANAVQWRDNNAAKAPGQMAALSMQAVARGADGVLFFQWRQSAAGAEKFHSAMLPHAGPETRTYREVEMLGADLSELGDLPAPGGEARVAIVLDWHNAWAIDQASHPAQFDYFALVQGWHAAFHQLNVQVDLVPPTGPFEPYELVIAPSLYLIADAGPLVGFVERGGRLLVTAFSDVVDEHDRFRPGGFTRRLGGVLGLAVVDFPGVRPGEAPVVWTDGGFEGDVLAEVVRLDGAEVLGRFASGNPAVTRNAVGDGEAYYVATMPDAAGRAALARHLVRRGGIEPVKAGLPERVEACARGSMVTLINHNPVPVAAAGGVLGPYGYRVIKPS